MPTVSADLYEILSLAMRYVFAFLGILILLRAFRWMLADRREQRARLRRLPDAGCVGELLVLRGSRELPENTFLPVPREGILGSVRTCDLPIPCPGVRRDHLDFVWEDGLGLLLLPRRGCAVAVNDQPLDPASDPRLLPLTHGDVLTVGQAALRLHVFAGLQTASDFRDSSTPEADLPSAPAPEPQPLSPEAQPAAPFWIPDDPRSAQSAAPLWIPDDPRSAQSAFPEECPAPPPFPATDGQPAPDTGVFPPFPAAPEIPASTPEIPASAPDHAGTNPPRDPSRYRRPRRADRWKEDWSE